MTRFTEETMKKINVLVFLCQMFCKAQIQTFSDTQNKISIETLPTDHHIKALPQFLQVVNHTIFK